MDKLTHKRVFDIDIETFSECGGDVKIIANTEDPAVIQEDTCSPGWECKFYSNSTVAGLQGFADDANQQTGLILRSKKR